VKYLVTSKFNQVPTDAILALIPAETARGKELDVQGIRLKLYIAADQSQAWQIYQGDTQADIQKALESFPLYPFLTITITPLAAAANE
jgi:muconolactone delta-isomerase